MRRAVLLLAAALASGPLFGKDAGMLEAKKLELEQAIRAELPNGSDAAAVAGFLDRRGIEHSSYLERERAILGIVRDVSRNGPVSAAIKLQFAFDAERKLTGIEMGEVRTGP